MFEEKFSETVPQFPVVYDNGSFSKDTSSFHLSCACLRRWLKDG